MKDLNKSHGSACATKPSNRAIEAHECWHNQLEPQSREIRREITDTNQTAASLIVKLFRWTAGERLVAQLSIHSIW